jgi:pyridoxamine 5'-phosphate oxidase
VTEPLVQLAQWIDDAGGRESMEAIAMCLATCDRQGHPSARMVLLRGLDDRGLRFYTSYSSRKGHELTENPFAAALFFWPQLGRQVRIEGSVTRLSEDESDEYFNSRPRGHRLGAWASEQSEPIEAYETLQERYAHFEARFEGEEVPRPHSWGGYLLEPARVEFWHNRANRLHERIVYVREGRGWEIDRLQP